MRKAFGYSSDARAIHNGEVPGFRSGGRKQATGIQVTYAQAAAMIPFVVARHYMLCVSPTWALQAVLRD